MEHLFPTLRNSFRVTIPTSNPFSHQTLSRTPCYLRRQDASLPIFGNRCMSRYTACTCLCRTDGEPSSRNVLRGDVGLLPQLLRLSTNQRSPSSSNPAICPETFCMCAVSGLGGVLQSGTTLLEEITETIVRALGVHIPYSEPYYEP